MTTHSTTRRFARSVSYGIQRLLLQLYGPADSQNEDDPIRVLKRRFHRAPDEFEGRHIRNVTG